MNQFAKMTSTGRDRANVRPMLHRDFEPLRAAILNVLLHPLDRDWTVQGLGMLRCYPFGMDDFRLNVWNDRFRVTSVSETHDHPWHFTSWILSGEMRNQRFYEMPGGEEYELKTINCGIDTGDGHIDLTHLERMPVEILRPGDVYSQQANEIHSTSFADGTVTLNKRTRVNGNVARIFWPKGIEWIDAGPRDATEDEVRHGVAAALSIWRTDA